MLRRTAALATAGALAAAGIAVLVPTAADAASHAGKAGKPSKAAKAERQQLRKTGHIEVVRDLQRGTVTAVSPTSITLKSKDGYVHSYALTSTTRFRRAKQAVTESTVTVGAAAQVVAVDDQARRVTLAKK